MKLHRIYTEQTLEAGSIVTLATDASRHLLKVLKLRPGTEICLFNGDGHNYTGLLRQPNKHQAQVEVKVQSPLELPPAFAIHLGLAISKGERMDFALQKAVELGVTHITPLITERTVVRLDKQRMEKRSRHWSGVIVAACEQSGRCYLPTFNSPEKLNDWIASPSRRPCLVLHPEAKQTIVDLQPPQQAIHLVVGPEGGLSDNEISLALSQGCESIRLGPRILRTETAPMAVIAAIQTCWGDFR